MIMMQFGKIVGMILVVAVLGVVSLLDTSTSQAQTATATPQATGTTTPTRSPMMAPQEATGTRSPMMGAPTPAATATPDPRVTQQLFATLRGGGYVIYFRHATTDRSQQDTDTTNLANCATQRNLSDQGRAQARAIGDAFRSRGIPFGQVLSSEYCRAQEHARLAFGRAQVEPSLVLPDPLPAEQRQRNTTALQQLLATPPAAGMNTIMVSHSTNIRDAVGVDLSVEGSAAIVKVEQGRPTVVAVVLPGDWTPQAATDQVPATMPRSGTGGRGLVEIGSLATLVGVLLVAGGVTWQRRRHHR